jgi:peptide/nickel transport system ATP-binding protein
MTETPLLEVRDLTRVFSGAGGKPVTVVNGVSFDVFPSETLGLVGESGSGKSTIGRAVLMLPPPTSGSVRFDGQSLTELSDAGVRAARQRMQIVFQDPYSALNPRMRIGDFISEPLRIHNALPAREIDGEVASLLAKVGLDADAARRYPHQFSGGQRQRIAIARAIALKPKLIVADEPISALDVSIQAQIINLLLDLQDALALSYLFISHDLRVVRRICHRVAVLSRGRIVELAATEQLFANPRHAYTRRLLDAIPVPDPAIERKRVRARSSGSVAELRPAGHLEEVEAGHFVEVH